MAGLYGRLQDVVVDIMRAHGLGPIAKWVDDHVFFRLPMHHLHQYNKHRSDLRHRIAAGGGEHHTGGRIWYGGLQLPDGRIEEYDDDMTKSLQSFARTSQRPTCDQDFAYNMADIDLISQQLGLPWETSKDIPVTFYRRRSLNSP